MRLKIAVQKSGRLTDNSLDLLSRCGLKYSRGKDQLMCYGENMPLDVLFVRDDDIPDLVQEDVCDLGLVGLNVVEEKRLAFAARDITPLFETVQLLDFGRCKLCIAVPDGFDYRGAESLQGKRIATTYPHILGRFLAERGIAAEVVVLSGSVEIAPRLGRADLICDLVSTGSTLAANHLRQAEVVFESQAALIRTPVPIAAEKQEWARRLLMRIDGVEQVKGSKYIMLHAPRSALPAIAKLLPGEFGQALALAVGVGVLGDRQVIRDLWLLPARDVVALGIWIWSFAGNTVAWRGQHFSLKDGKMSRLTAV